MGLRVVLYLGGELVYDFFFYRGSVYSFEGCSENFMYFLFFFVYISLLCTGLVTILLHTLYFIFIYMMMMYVFPSPTSPCVVSFLSLYICFFMYAGITHDALMSFV